MDKILSTGSYGICVFSLEILQDFLEKKRVRSKKRLEKFQKNKDFYLGAQKESIWIPFAGINSIDYVIKLKVAMHPLMMRGSKGWSMTDLILK